MMPCRGPDVRSSSARRGTVGLLAVLAAGCLSPGDPEAEALAVGPSIQGAGHVSPLDGESIVDLQVVVIARDERRRSPGFWVGLGEDGDPRSSDGLRVDVDRGVPTPGPGERVMLSGRVREVAGRSGELSVTRLVEARWIVTGDREPVPPAVAIGQGELEVPSQVDDDGLTSFDPESDAIDFFESLEGMRVAVNDGSVVGGTSRFGEVFVAVGDAAPRTARGGLLAREGDDGHAHRLVIDPGSFRMPRLRVGDRFTAPLVGVVDYSFGNYRVVLTEPPPDVDRADIRRDRTALRRDASHLTLATYNVQNLGGDDSDRAFEDLARSVVEDLGSPDVVGLQEIQDASGEADDGTVAGAPVLRRLAKEIERAGGPAYRHAQIDPGNNQDGGAPGSNIRVAFLYDPARVEVVGTRRLAERSEHFRGSRKPLLVEFRFRGRSIFAVNNHLSSKRSDDRAYGSAQPPQRHSERRRLAQAQELAAEVGALRRLADDARIVVLGDFNEHEFRAPLLALETAGLENLVRLAPPEDRYTYNFQGVSQVLDAVLVSRSLEQDAEVDIVHVNADFPADGRVSDHDPVLVRLRVD